MSSFVRRLLVLAPLAPAAALLLATSAGCGGTTVPYTFEGEPVCADFAINGGELLRGGLKRPLHVAFKSGSEVVARVVLVGLRTPGEGATPILLPDADAEYEVEWAECENERAPGVASKNKPFDTKFECGAFKPYGSSKLTTKKGETKRTIPVTAPEQIGCWSEANR